MTKPYIDPALAEELAPLTDDQRREVEVELDCRERAGQIAAELGLDPQDVRVILENLALSPSERLRRGLALGRSRSR